MPTNRSGARQSGSSPVALSVSTAPSGTCERSDPLDASIDVGAELGSAEVGGRRHLLSNVESREYIESRVETPLKGKGPLIGSACLFTTRSHVLAEDLSRRSVIPGLGAKLSVALTKRIDLVVGYGYGINAPRGNGFGGQEFDAEFQFKY